MFKLIKKNWRISKNFNSAFIASMIVSFFFGKYISVLFNLSTPMWVSGWKNSLILTVIVMIFLFGAYKIYENYGAEDLRDMQNFYENFFMGLIVVIVSTIMIMYNSYFPKTLYWIGSSLIILIIYFPLNWLYLRYRPKN